MILLLLILIPVIPIAFIITIKLVLKYLAKGKLDLASYAAFKHDYFYKPTYQRFGQYFCNKFNITDNTLYYEHDISIAEKIILDKYVTL